MVDITKYLKSDVIALTSSFRLAAMSDYYWIKHVTPLRMSMIDQIWYYIERDDEEDTKFIDVMYYNLNDKKRYFRTRVPISYDDHLTAFLWRH